MGLLSKYKDVKFYTKCKIEYDKNGYLDNIAFDDETQIKAVPQEFDNAKEYENCINNINEKFKWENNLYVTYCDQNGRYLGEIDTNGLPNNVGIYEGSSCKYIGEWINGKMKGKGKMFFNNNNKYEGKFLDNFQEGIGTYTWSDGVKYVGNFEKDKHKEFGAYTFKNKENNNIDKENNDIAITYDNDNNKITSITKGGIIYDPKEHFSIKHNKNYLVNIYYNKNDNIVKPINNGSQIDLEDKLTDKLTTNQMTTCYFPNGAKYEGQIIDGKLDGICKITWLNGMIYDGVFDNGENISGGLFIPTTIGKNNETTLTYPVNDSVLTQEIINNETPQEIYKKITGYSIDLNSGENEEEDEEKDEKNSNVECQEKYKPEETRRKESTWSFKIPFMKKKFIYNWPCGCSCVDYTEQEKLII